MPYGLWMKRELREIMETLLTNTSLSRCGYFDPTTTRNLWMEHLQGSADHSRPLWAIANYLLWYESYFVHKDYRRLLPTPRQPRRAQDS